MYRNYSEVDGNVLTLRDGERILSIAIAADGGTDATLQYHGFKNFEGKTNGSNPSLVTVKSGGTWGQDWNGAIESDGTSTLTFAGLGHYTVQTVQQ